MTRISKNNNMTRSKSVGASPNTPGRGTAAVLASQCDGHEHFEMEIVDEIFDIDVDEMFTMLFTDSTLFSKFIDRRRTYDVTLAPWSDDVDENGRKTRTIHYTLSINYAIGPKCSPSTESQVLYTKQSQPGEYYLIDADCVNGGVPYSDHFSTVIRYCIKRLEANSKRTRLCITGHVVYHKTVWSFIRNFIQKTAVSGLSESFGVMAQLLRETASQMNDYDGDAIESSATRQSAPLAQRPRTLQIQRCRRRAGQTSTPSFDDDQLDKTDDVKRRLQLTAQRLRPGNRTRDSPSSKTGDKSTSSWLDSGDHSQLLVALVFVVMLALVVVNALLYYQLTALETTVNTRLLSNDVIRRHWVT